MAENIQTLKAELSALESKLEAKKRELAGAGKEQTEPAIFKAVIREHAGAPALGETIVPGSGLAPKPGATSAASTPDPQAEIILNQMVEHAFSKGITSAVAEAKKYNIPFLVDMLHDRLADEYYQKLLAARKIKTE